MKIHLKQVPAEGLHLEGKEDCPIQELEADGIRCAGPLHYDLDIGISSDGLWASGSLNQPVEVTCVACLEKFVYEIKVPAFALHKELQGPETVDFTPFIREDILLNLPAHPRCDRDGGRICKAAHLEMTEQTVKRQPDWSALDKLKLK
ncbi:MAG TPA: hypothetical protein VJ252_03065 [Chthoniobacterales bacterium]|nr:hypothetical protein [Chthoniobacterales bacterium]